MNTTSCFFAGALSVLAVAAQAGHFSSGPMAGATLGGVTEQGELILGGQGTYYWDNGFSVELAVMQFTDEPEEERFGIRVTTDQDIVPLHLSARYAFPVVDRRLDAYVLAGVSYYFEEESSVEIQNATPIVTQTGPLEVERDDAFGYQVGAGLEYYFNAQISALVEYRYGGMDSDAHLSGLQANNAQGQVAVDAFEKDFWDNNELGFCRIALNWHF